MATVGQSVNRQEVSAGLMFPTHWKSVCESIVREAAPEDCEGLPIHFVERSEVPVTWPEQAKAFTGLPAVRFSMVAGGPGRGFSACFDLEQFSSWRELIGAVCHEFSHFLDSPPPPIEQIPQPDNPETEKLLQVYKTLLAEHTLKMGDQYRADMKTPPKWFLHEERFVRAAAHMAVRVGALVESVRPSHLSFGERYFGFPFTEATWVGTLEAELSYRGSIRALLDIEPPEQFIELYRLATAGQF